jgi:hypothetical protein
MYPKQSRNRAKAYTGMENRADKAHIACARKTAMTVPAR